MRCHIRSQAFALCLTHGHKLLQRLGHDRLHLRPNHIGVFCNLLHLERIRNAEQCGKRQCICRTAGLASRSSQHDLIFWKTGFPEQFVFRCNSTQVCHHHIVVDLHRRILAADGLHGERNLNLSTRDCLLHLFLDLSLQIAETAGQTHTGFQITVIHRMHFRSDLITFRPSRSTPVTRHTFHFCHTPYETARNPCNNIP